MITNKIVFNVQKNLFEFFHFSRSYTQLNCTTLSQYPSWIHPGELPGENLVHKKSLPGEECLDVFTFRTILNNLFFSEVNTKSLIVPSEFLNFNPMSFDITPVILLSPWCVAASRWDQGNLRKRFPQLNFLVMIDWILFVFIETSWWVENWMLSTQKCFHQNTFDEGFPCDDRGLARLSCVNIFQDSGTQWSTLRSVG